LIVLEAFTAGILDRFLNELGLRRRPPSSGATSTVRGTPHHRRSPVGLANILMTGALVDQTMGQKMIQYTTVPVSLAGGVAMTSLAWLR